MQPIGISNENTDFAIFSIFNLPKKYTKTYIIVYTTYINTIQFRLLRQIYKTNDR